MAREFSFIAEDETALQLQSSGGLLLLSVIAVFLSVTSMLIFACADCPESDPNKKGHGGGGRNVGGGCGTAGGGGCGG